MTSRRQILMKAAERLPPDKPPAGLVPPARLSPLGEELLEIFREMNRMRPRNGFDVCPLDPVFFMAWQWNRQCRLSDFELSALIELDETFRKVMADV